MEPNFEGKIMAQQLYRRHRKECEAGRPEDSKSSQFKEGFDGPQRVRLHGKGDK